MGHRHAGTGGGQNRRQRRAAGITEPKNLEEQAISLIGTDIYTKLIKGYTEKQWGRSCTDLPAFIIKRLPVRYTFDNNYFDDCWQGIPKGGYNVLIDASWKASKCGLASIITANGRRTWI